MSACVVNQSTLHHRHFSIIMKHKIHILAIDDKKIVGGSRLHRGAFLESFHYFMTIIFDAGNVQQSIKHKMGSCSSSIYFTSKELRFMICSLQQIIITIAEQNQCRNQIAFWLDWKNMQLTSMRVMSMNGLLLYRNL